jgi:hypothetical protein
MVHGHGGVLILEELVDADAGPLRDRVRGRHVTLARAQSTITRNAFRIKIAHPRRHVATALRVSVGID